MTTDEEVAVLKKRVEDLEDLVKRMALSQKDVLEKYLPELANKVAETITTFGTGQNSLTNKVADLMKALNEVVAATEKRFDVLELGMGLDPIEQWDGLATLSAGDRVGAEVSFQNPVYVDPKTVRGIGRLTIGFNEIDFIIGVYANYFLGVHEFSMGEKIAAREKFFAQRRELMVDILEVLKVEYTDLSATIESLKSLLGTAKTLADKRNSIVHGLLVFDPKEGRFALRHRQRDNAWPESDLTTLVDEVADLEDSLTEECYGLKEALDAKRSGSSE